MRFFSDASQFVDFLLTAYLADLRVQQVDNYDWHRFSGDGVDRSDVPYDSLHKEALLAVTRQGDALFRAYMLLQDQTSRDLFIDLLRYRMAGHKHVKLPTNNPTFTAKVDAFRAIEGKPCAPDVPVIPGMPLAHYDFPFAGQNLSMDILTLIWPFGVGQYYYDRDGIRIQPEKGDHVVDAGACFGDTAMAFGSSVGKAGAVYLFEMMDIPITLCTRNMRQNAAVSSFHLIQAGLSDKVQTGTGHQELSQHVDLGFELMAEDTRFTTTTLDHLVETGALPRVDFIKMDIEGSELRALRGAEQVLRRFRPKLAISLYHHVQDFYEIPAFLDDLSLGYRFYLDHYTIHAGETVLYAIAQ